MSKMVRVQQDQDIALLRANVQRSAESLVAARHESAKLSRAFTASESRGLYLERELSLLQTRLARCKEQLQASLRCLAEEQAISNTLQAELAAVRSSTAWRATGPVRHLLERYTGMARLGRRALLFARSAAILRLPANLR